MFGITPEGALHKKLRLLGQKVRDFLKKIHAKIGVYGWIALGLLIILISTVMHYECNERRSWKVFHRPMYIHKQSDWMRDIDRDFENMHRQMDAMRARHERMMRDVWETPIDPKTTMTSIVSNGDYQYSVNTRDGKLDGFVTTSDATKASALLAQIKGLGLTVDQKDSKLFFKGDAQKLNDLLRVLGK